MHASGRRNVYPRFNTLKLSLTLPVLYIRSVILAFWPRDSIGGGSVVGDVRWAGAFGINADLIARSHCAVEFVSTEVIQVRLFVH